MMEADRLLFERLQLKEIEELTNEEKAKLFIELMKKRRKHFAALRAQEKRNRPPTKEQKRTQMSTYLKHMGGYTYKQLKGKSFNEIKKLFDKEIKRVNTFVAMGSEVQENKEKKEEGREETAKGSRKKMLGRKKAAKRKMKGEDCWDLKDFMDSLKLLLLRRNLKIQKMNIKFRGGLLGLKRLHGFLEVTTAQVHNGNYAKCAAGEKIITADYNFLKTF
ncbi:hypothetical protein Tco_0831167 [Tanacetum coccineum]